MSPHNTVSGMSASKRTVFQCFLFMCQAGRIPDQLARNSMARSGSHFKFTRSCSVSSEASANIFPPTLKTKVVSSKGKQASAPSFSIQ